MKVRGRRNRAKVAARHATRLILHHVVAEFDPATGATTFRTGKPGEATHSIAVNGPTRDGYGRIVPTPAPRHVVAPRRAGKSTASSWSMGFSFKTEGDAASAKGLHDLLTGKGESVDAT
jgi:hypothetical protein